MPRLLLCGFLAATLAACSREADRAPRSPDAIVDSVAADSLPVVAPAPVADTTAPALDADPAKVAALNVALDTLEAFVAVLEQVEGPITAWNLGAEAARLLGYLERNQETFALDETDAARRYPAQVDRLNRLENRREAALERIQADPATARVLVEEMAKAEATSE